MVFKWRGQYKLTSPTSRPESIRNTDFPKRVIRSPSQSLTVKSSKNWSRSPCLVVDGSHGQEKLYLLKGPFNIMYYNHIMNFTQRLLSSLLPSLIDVVVLSLPISLTLYWQSFFWFDNRFSITGELLVMAKTSGLGDHSLEEYWKYQWLALRHGVNCNHTCTRKSITFF